MICDFGQATQTFERGEEATQSGCVRYMAPELARSFKSEDADRKALCEKADVYSFGLTSYEVSDHV